MGFCESHHVVLGKLVYLWASEFSFAKAKRKRTKEREDEKNIKTFPSSMGLVVSSWVNYNIRSALVTTNVRGKESLANRYID